MFQKYASIICEFSTFIILSFSSLLFNFILQNLTILVVKFVLGGQLILINVKIGISGICNETSAQPVISQSFSAFGTAASNGGGNIDERTAKQLMEEEAAAMEKFRSSTSASNPFAAAPAQAAAEETPNILDLFGVAAPVNSAPAPAPAQPQQTTASAASDDLLQLTGNPFANMLNGENES